MKQFLGGFIVGGIAVGLVMGLLKPAPSTEPVISKGRYQFVGGGDDIAVFDPQTGEVRADGRIGTWGKAYGEFDPVGRILDSVYGDSQPKR